MFLCTQISENISAATLGHVSIQNTWNFTSNYVLRKTLLTRKLDSPICFANISPKEIHFLCVWMFFQKRHTHTQNRFFANLLIIYALSSMLMPTRFFVDTVDGNSKRFFQSVMKIHVSMTLNLAFRYFPQNVEELLIWYRMFAMSGRDTCQKHKSIRNCESFSGNSNNRVKL